MIARLTRRSFLAAALFLPVARLRSGAFPPELSPEAASARLASIEARRGGRLGVAALDTRDGKVIEHRGFERFPMCSTFKFLLVAGILSSADAGQETLDRVVHYTQADLLDYAPITRAHLGAGGMTVRSLCAAAIEYSDNTAANLLLDVLGGPAAVSRYARSVGDRLTRLDRNEPSLNTAIPGDVRDTTTPKAMVADMRAILLGAAALTPASRNQLEAWMVGNTTGGNSLRRGLPSAWRIGDKTGSGEHGATNDIAICRPADRAPILVAAYFVGSSASSADRYSALAAVGRIVAASFS